MQHDTYDRLAVAAKSGKPTASKTKKVVDETRNLMCRAGKRVHAPFDQRIVEEKLAEAALESNPWLACELQTA